MQTVFFLNDGGTAAAVAALASAALQAASKIGATPTQGVALGLGRAARWASNWRPEVGCDWEPGPGLRQDHLRCVQASSEASIVASSSRPSLSVKAAISHGMIWPSV